MAGAISRGRQTAVPLRWFRNEYGAIESTRRDYEAVLANMSAIGVGLLGSVAEYERAAALTAGVYDRASGRGRELLEHLGA